MAISLAGRVTIAIVYLMEARALYGLGRERWLNIVLAIALNHLLAFRRCLVNHRLAPHNSGTVKCTNMARPLFRILSRWYCALCRRCPKFAFLAVL
jgi:hypothetical protein